MSLSKTLPNEFDKYIQTIAKKYKVLEGNPNSPIFDREIVCKKIQKEIDREQFIELSGLCIEKVYNKYFLDGEEMWYLNFDIHEIVIPDDMLHFYNMYNECIFTHKNISTDKDKPKFCRLDKLYHANEWIATTPEFSEKPIILEGDANTVNMLDYFVFFEDPNSSSNGCGFFFTCLNPESIHYREVFAFSSSDDGYFTKVASTFTEFLYVLSENADMFLNGKWNHDFNEECAFNKLSICDFVMLLC